MFYMHHARHYLVKNSFLAYFVSRTILTVTDQTQEHIFPVSSMTTLKLPNFSRFPNEWPVVTLQQPPEWSFLGQVVMSWTASVHDSLQSGQFWVRSTASVHDSLHSGQFWTWSTASVQDSLHSGQFWVRSTASVHDSLHSGQFWTWSTASVQDSLHSGQF